MSHTLPIAVAQYNEWAALGLLFLASAGFALLNIVLSAVLGPKRRGTTKEKPYESGMEPVGDTKQRFNVRFYLVAMIFLVFDVEVLFLIPWRTIFPKHTFDSLGIAPYIAYGSLFASVLVFTAIILVAYIYAWGKGVFKWD